MRLGNVADFSLKKSSREVYNYSTNERLNKGRRSLLRKTMSKFEASEQKPVLEEDRVSALVEEFQGNPSGLRVFLESTRKVASGEVAPARKYIGSMPPPVDALEDSKLHREFTDDELQEIRDKAQSEVSHLEEALRRIEATQE